MNHRREKRMAHRTPRIPVPCKKARERRGSSNSEAPGVAGKTFRSRFASAAAAKYCRANLSVERHLSKGYLGSQDKHTTAFR
jgi:hypothetical protein